VVKIKNTLAENVVVAVIHEELTEIAAGAEAEISMAEGDRVELRPKP